MPFIDPGVYADTVDKSYEVESCYYLEFQIKSALISLKKLEQEIDTDFDSKYQYYHFYVDHLLYSLGQIGNRFIATDKDRGLNLERKNANCINFEFTQEKYPILIVCPTSTLPVSGFTIPLIIRRSVVFPHPFGPIIPIRSFLRKI